MIPFSSFSSHVSMTLCPFLFRVYDPAPELPCALSIGSMPQIGAVPWHAGRALFPRQGVGQRQGLFLRPRARKNDAPMLPAVPRARCLFKNRTCFPLSPPTLYPQAHWLLASTQGATHSLEIQSQPSPVPWLRPPVHGRAHAHNTNTNTSIILPASPKPAGSTYARDRHAPGSHAAPRRIGRHSSSPHASSHQLRVVASRKHPIILYLWSPLLAQAHLR